MTPAQKRRALRRQHLQPKGPREVGNFVRAPGPNARRYDVLKDLMKKKLLKES